jgi:hypothetical protein
MSYDIHSLEGYSTVVSVTGTNPNLTITVQAGDGVKFGTPQNATIWANNSQPIRANSTIGRITGIAGDVLTVVTNQEGSASRTVQPGDQIANSITPKVFTDIEAAKVEKSAVKLDQSPVETPNNTIAVFTLPNADVYVAGSLQVWLNGLLQRVPGDYSETTPSTITFIAPLLSSDTVQLAYRTS